MTHKSLFPVAFILFIVNACSKSDKHNNPSSSNSYQSGNTLTIDQLGLYTNNGIITDAATLQSFIDRRVGDAQFNSWFYVGKKTVTDPTIAKELVIIDDKHARLNRKDLEIIQKSDTLLLLAEMDSTNVPAKTDDRCEELPRLVPAIKPTTYCAGGACTKYRKTYPIIVSNGDYYLPTLYFYATHSKWIVAGGLQGKETCGRLSTEYPLLNFVNKDLVDQLETLDTVLVQTGRVKFNKR